MITISMMRSEFFLGNFPLTLFPTLSSCCSLVSVLSCFRKNSYVGDKDNWYYTLGWFHFLRQGFFANDRCPDDRWKRISQEQNIQIQPWITKRRDERKYALICLQKKKL